jgi:hypothetical protein
MFMEIGQGFVTMDAAKTSFHRAEMLNFVQQD